MMGQEIRAILHGSIAGRNGHHDPEELPPLTGDEAEALDRLADAIGERGAPVVRRSGRIVVASCATPLKALETAVAFQRAWQNSHPDNPQSMASRLRVGIAVGSAEVTETTMAGDAVLIAERLSQLAEPGGIYVSQGIVDEAKGRIDVGFADHGLQFVRNVEESVNIFEVLLNRSDATKMLPRLQRIKPPAWPWMVAAIAFWVAFVGLLSWWQPWSTG